MKHLEQSERDSLAPFDPSEIDKDFIPYLEKINRTPFAATLQCCIGHCDYSINFIKPPGSSDHWGYLQLLMTAPSAVWLSQEVSKCEWLLRTMSKFWSDDAKEKPSYTKYYNFVIAFAWDSKSWPEPADQICDLIEKYNQANPDEPPSLLKPEGLVDHPVKQRPNLSTLKRRGKRKSS